MNVGYRQDIDSDLYAFIQEFLSQMNMHMIKVMIKVTLVIFWLKNSGKILLK